MTTVLFVQLPPPRFVFEEPQSNIPLAAGFLSQALAGADSDSGEVEIFDPEIGDILADCGLVEAIVDRRPQILALTLYVWNVKRSLYLAAQVKRELPETRVLVGGPEVTPDNEWALNHPAVDAGIFGEGESRLTAVVEALLGGCDLRAIPSVFFKMGDRVRMNRRRADPWPLEKSGCPYCDGTLRPSADGTLFIETVRGCPFRCRYCYYHKAFDRMRPHSDASIDACLRFAYATDSPVREIYLMDPSFNVRPGFRTLLRRVAELREGKDVAVHTELRADLLTDDDVRLLKEAGLKTAEIGLQSVNPTALEIAGRSTDVERVERGARRLLDVGIDVTTGIILGLPGDTAEGFRATINRLKETGAYSVVQPFTLSVLPGTDFRRNAANLGITYDPRPPYHVKSVPSFSSDEFQPLLLEFESVFGVELDCIPAPSLVDSGDALIAKTDIAPYVSKWIVNPELRRAWASLLPHVIRAASDPFTFWFRGAQEDVAALEMLQAFVFANPHAVLQVVMEFTTPPSVAFLRGVIDTACDPSLYVNRVYTPLYGEGECVSPLITVVRGGRAPFGGDDSVREEWASYAATVWDLGSALPSDYADVKTPVLISRLWESVSDPDALFKDLHGIVDDRPEEILFRCGRLQEKWTRDVRGIEPSRRLSERILMTV